MNKMIIPRRDHEVYFIPRPEGLKTRTLRPYVIEQLDRLHPGFSAASRIDVQQFVFNGARWIMATVMDAETFAEYRILHKGSVFYTNTSIAVHKKGFANGGINVIEDEYIGFDAEKKEPLSVPLETASRVSSTETSTGAKAIPARYGVFGRKPLPGYAAAVIAAAALLLFLPAAFFFNESDITTAALVETNAEPAAELKRLPSAMEILAYISAGVVDSGGEMAQWQYNEDIDPLLIIRMKGIDVLTAHEICARYDYFLLQDVKEVRYSGGEPYLTLYIHAARAGYAVPAAVSFPPQDIILPVSAGLTHDFRREGITIASETLPSFSGGNNLYTVTYTANGGKLIRSLDIIGSYCGAYQLSAKMMDISINSGSSYFTVVCSLARSDAPPSNSLPENSEKEKIPRAFGYRDNTQVIAAPHITTTENNPEMTILGTIRDSSGQMLFYRDIHDAKIKVRGNP